MFSSRLILLELSVWDRISTFYAVFIDEDNCFSDA